MQDDFSVERLMEFGIGMAMAKQMADMVSQSMHQTSVPQVPVLENKLDKVYAVFDGKQSGPFNEKELKKMAVENYLDTDTLVWFPGLTQWTRAIDVPELYKILLLAR